MPLTHIGLTVSHLPTSTSFFLAALHPLGYQYFGQDGPQIGLGTSSSSAPDFFLCQETPGLKAGAAHIAFSAPSREAVKQFYNAALAAGARPHGSPAARGEEGDTFNAAVLDFDGNSIEVVHREEPKAIADVEEKSAAGHHSRVLTWRKDVAESLRDDKSMVSAARSSHSKTIVPAPAQTIDSRKAPTVRSVARSASAPVYVPSNANADDTQVSGKTIMGTLLGAAAGAAVAYAMCKGDEDSTKVSGQQAYLSASAQARRQSLTAAQVQEKLQAALPVAGQAIRSARGALEGAESYLSRETRVSVRMIEAAPVDSGVAYQSPAYESVAPTRVSRRKELEYAPSLQRSVTMPVPGSVAGKSHARASTLIESLHPEEVSRGQYLLEPAPSTHSHKSSKSTKSSKSKAKSKHSTASHSRAPTAPPPSTHSKASKARSQTSHTQSVTGGSVVLGRSAIIEEPDDEDDGRADEAWQPIKDYETVAPSDSISNAGSRRSSHSRAKSSSKHSKASRSESKHSSKSKHSSTKHSSHSKASKHRSHGAVPEVQRPYAISESGSTSTVKPSKTQKRRDSAQEQWIDVSHEYGGGSIASLPVRGITPSMVHGHSGGPRSAATFAFGV